MYVERFDWMKENWISSIPYEELCHVKYYKDNSLTLFSRSSSHHFNYDYTSFKFRTWFSYLDQWITKHPFIILEYTVSSPSIRYTQYRLKGKVYISLYEAMKASKLFKDENELFLYYLKW